VKAPRPYNLVAELTYRCPLRCPYCSNPVDFRDSKEALDAEGWGGVFRQAAELGVIHVGLSGGEPALRGDLDRIIAAASGVGLYSHLVTSGMQIDHERLEQLQQAGLHSVQLSIQDSDPREADRISGVDSFRTKIAFARSVRTLGLPLVLNVVLHRHNLERVEEIIALARDLDAERLELANTQYHGWALVNRAALLPTRSQLDAAGRVARAAQRMHSRPEIVFVLPDYWAERPKPCMGGWGRKTMVVAPDGRVQPCQAAASLPGLEFWKVGERSLAACWEDAPGMNAFRGEDWMREPCRSCPERARDFGGCRCQAFALCGDAAAPDPACSLVPERDSLLRARSEAPTPLRYRGQP
jgi:pyrroloquinoline quinone biosynthesis protein E